MHTSALLAGKLFFEIYWRREFQRVLDVGSQDVNGTLRSVKPEGAIYLGVDMAPGVGVDVVLKDPHQLPLADGSFDVVVSTSCLEHDPLFWLSVAEMFRVVKPGGFVYINAPSNGIYHGYPFDHWRFYPDAAQALVRWSTKLSTPVQLVESFVGEKVGDIWADNVMVFLREPYDGRLPDKCICDQVLGATNIRRHGSSEFDKFDPIPEDLRELNTANERIKELEQEALRGAERQRELQARIDELEALKEPESLEGLNGSRPVVAESNSFKTAFTSEFLKGYQAGTLGYTYKSVPCLKNPIDLAIYTKAIWDLQPGTIIELGANAGGSALWFADTLERFGYGAEVVCIDLQPPKDVKHERIRFIEGDVKHLIDVLTRNCLLGAPRPWLVVEDSAHTFETCLTVLEQTAVLLKKGDLLVIEDGVLDELGLSQAYGGGPNRALRQWFERQPDVFTVQRSLCDMFGRNASYAPNAWLRKT